VLDIENPAFRKCIEQVESNGFHATVSIILRS
jgi:hypothetical protein